MNWWNSIEFADPNWLWALLLLPVMAVVKIIRWNKQHGEVRMTYPAIKGWSWAALKPHLFWLSWLGLGCWIVAFARPRTADVSSLTKGNDGIDIMLTIDVSPSMLARDLKPNRLEALKEVATEFIESRPNDRIGMVAYATEAFGQTPLTTDHEIVALSVNELESGLLGNSTAIGTGLATAINRIKESEAKSKVIILLTDGKNMAGEIEPESAAQIAHDLGIKVYTIGVGSKGMAVTPMRGPGGNMVYSRQKVDIDEELLKSIAEHTNGRYFRAQNKEELSEIYSEIDRLETSKIEELKYVDYEEKFHSLAIAGLALIAFEVLLKNTLFRSVI